MNGKTLKETFIDAKEVIQIAKASIKAKTKQLIKQTETQIQNAERKLNELEEKSGNIGAALEEIKGQKEEIEGYKNSAQVSKNDAAAFRKDAERYLDEVRKTRLSLFEIFIHINPTVGNVQQERMLTTLMEELEQKGFFVLKMVYYHDEAIPEDAVRAYAEHLKNPGAKQAVLQTARQIIPSDIERLSQKYSQITTPTLILWGEEDELVPMSMGQRLHIAIPDSKLVVFEDTGHAPKEENPAGVLSAVEAFLADEGRDHSQNW
jgi:hypothetical protein